jgi:hypothetical protein
VPCGSVDALERGSIKRVHISVYAAEPKSGAFGLRAASCRFCEETGNNIGFHTDSIVGSDGRRALLSRESIRYFFHFNCFLEEISRILHKRYCAESRNSGLILPDIRGREICC